MSTYEMEKLDHILKAHRRTLLEQQWKEQSMENGFPVMQLQEAKDVLKQIDDNADSFFEDDDFVPVGNYCESPECDDCQSEMRAEMESEFRRSIQLAEEAIKRTEQGEFIRFEDVQEVE